MSETELNQSQRYWIFRIFILFMILLILPSLFIVYEFWLDILLSFLYLGEFRMSESIPVAAMLVAAATSTAFIWILVVKVPPLKRELLGEAPMNNSVVTSAAE